MLFNWTHILGIYIPSVIINLLDLLWWQDVDVPLCVLPGRIRNKAEVDDSAADAVLSLNIISAKNIKSSHNSNRYLKMAKRFESLSILKPVVLD